MCSYTGAGRQINFCDASEVRFFLFEIMRSGNLNVYLNDARPMNLPHVAPLKWK